MKRLLDMCKDIPFQASLERYIKCSVGICGQCCIGKGLRLCKDGPVFDGKTLKNTEDFGVYKRDSAGRIVRFQDGNHILLYDANNFNCYMNTDGGDTNGSIL